MLAFAENRQNKHTDRMSSQSGSTSSHRNQHCIDIVGFLRKRERERERYREKGRKREKEKVHENTCESMLERTFQKNDNVPRIERLEKLAGNF